MFYTSHIFDIIIEKWKEESSRRAFLVNYAIKKGFDPLLADNWYSQKNENILSEKVTYY